MGGEMPQRVMSENTARHLISDLVGRWLDFRHVGYRRT
jgi:hypothetical protein